MYVEGIDHLSGLVNWKFRVRHLPCTDIHCLVESGSGRVRAAI